MAPLLLLSVTASSEMAAHNGPCKALHEDLKEAIRKGDQIEEEQRRLIREGKEPTIIQKESFAVAGTTITRGMDATMTTEKKAAKQVAEEALKALRTRKAIAMIFEGREGSTVSGTWNTPSSAILSTWTPEKCIKCGSVHQLNEYRGECECKKCKDHGASIWNCNCKTQLEEDDDKEIEEEDREPFQAEVHQRCGAHREEDCLWDKECQHRAAGPDERESRMGKMVCNKNRGHNMCSECNTDWDANGQCACDVMDSQVDDGRYQAREQSETAISIIDLTNTPTGGEAEGGKKRKTTHSGARTQGGMALPMVQIIPETQPTPVGKEWAEYIQGVLREDEEEAAAAQNIKDEVGKIVMALKLYNENIWRWPAVREAAEMKRKEAALQQELRNLKKEVNRVGRDVGNLKTAQIGGDKIERKKLDREKKELKARAKAQEEEARRSRAIKEGLKKAEEIAEQ
ncbi:hypothetical protein DFH27DRAFT_617831 [Peziza echinospora]|nr:hypothetical protein DFH27DRAFT_617831 [Peziza echinospora]